MGIVRAFRFNDISRATACIDRILAAEVPPLARQNFKFEKRQKEIAKQKKAEEKRLRKQGIEIDDDASGENSPKEPSVDDWLSS